MLEFLLGIEKEELEILGQKVLLYRGSGANLNKYICKKPVVSISPAVFESNDSRYDCIITMPKELDSILSEHVRQFILGHEVGHMLTKECPRWRVFKRESLADNWGYRWSESKCPIDTFMQLAKVYFKISKALGIVFVIGNFNRIGNALFCLVSKNKEELRYE